MSQDNLGQIKENSEFLQSEEWRKFQESVGRKTFNISSDDFWANIIEHQLPIVGKYFYVPRGPILAISNKQQATSFLSDLINLAKENNAGWIRIEPENEEILEIIKNEIPKAKFFSSKGLALGVRKAPHDMQPREILVMDITRPEEELLAGMKPKTRYNIKLAQKHGVLASSEQETTNSKHIDRFIELVKITARRDRIITHTDNYYRKMFEVIPSDILKLYVAEYNGKIIAANLMVFFGKTATYLHGASDDKFRNVMAPYLLQWQAIRDAKMAGCEKYDLGGIHTKTGEGITKFKTGFAPNTKPVEFPGCYDLVLNLVKYYLYRAIQKLKWIL